MFTLAMVLQRASALMTERCVQLFAPVADLSSLRQSIELEGLGARGVRNSSRQRDQASPAQFRGIIFPADDLAGRSRSGSHATRRSAMLSKITTAVLALAMIVSVSVPASAQTPSYAQCAWAQCY